MTRTGQKRRRMGEGGTIYKSRQHLLTIATIFVQLIYPSINNVYFNILHIMGTLSIDIKKLDLDMYQDYRCIYFKRLIDN